MSGNLLCELIAAHRTARRPELAEALDACGLPILGVPIWGVEFVELAGDHYQPRRGGHPAIIIPVFDDGVLIDLVATGLRARECRTRAGIATVLGQEWIDLARANETALQLFSDPIEWLRNDRRGAVVIDWRAACFALADVPEIVFSNDVLARRVYNAMTRPQRLPRLLVREVRRVAA